MTIWLTVNLLVLLVAYGLGSIPPGYWAGRLLKGIDIREHGSGSTGATNVLRVIGKGPALVVFVVDVSKGILAVAGIRWFYPMIHEFLQTQAPAVTISPDQWLPWLVVLTAFAALLGHSKSIWLNFTGGKSVATGLGLLLILDWRVALATFAVFGLMLALSRIVSLSSIIAAVAVSGFMLWLDPLWSNRVFALVGGLYVIGRHRSNIQRLLVGEEPRLGDSTT